MGGGGGGGERLSKNDLRRWELGEQGPDSFTIRAWGGGVFLL